MSDDVVARALVSLQETFEMIERLTALGREKVEEDEFLSLAAQQLGIRLGHDVAAIPDSWRRQRPDVPWRSIRGLRNRLAHDYHQVDFDILWSAFEESVPQIRSQLAEDLSWAIEQRDRESHGEEP